jgi:molybdopterin synthase sulfur carrier subunit
MGCASEHIVLPNEVKNVGMLLDWLPTRDERFKGVLVSVNLHYADRDHPVHDEDEVIFAPPIAGG